MKKAILIFIALAVAGTGAFIAITKQSESTTIVKKLRREMKLSDYANEADIVIVGTVASTKERSEFDNHIGYALGYTDITVKPTEVLKGTINGSTITVTVIGSQSVKTLAEDEELPTNKNKTYLWFLANGEKENQWGSLGTFEQNNSSWKSLAKGGKELLDSDVHSEIKKIKETK